METLTPRTNAEPMGGASPIPQDVLEAGINLKNAVFLEYLGMKDELFNQQVIEKLEEIGKYAETVDDLMALDVKTGIKPGITKLDKLYVYAKLMSEENKIMEKQALITKQKQQWEKEAQMQ